MMMMDPQAHSGARTLSQHTDEPKRERANKREDEKDEEEEEEKKTNTKKFNITLDSWIG